MRYLMLSIQIICLIAQIIIYIEILTPDISTSKSDAIELDIDGEIHEFPRSTQIIHLDYFTEEDQKSLIEAAKELRVCYCDEMNKTIVDDGFTKKTHEIRMKLSKVFKCEMICIKPNCITFENYKEHLTLIIELWQNKKKAI